MDTNSKATLVYQVIILAGVCAVVAILALSERHPIPLPNCEKLFMYNNSAVVRCQLE